MAPRDERDGAADTRALRRGPPASATACAAGSLGAALTWLGGSRILDKLERHGFDVFNHRPTLGAGDPGCFVAPLALAPSKSTLARDTSFYYSFLVLPADKRRAIIAVWDFCRAVDDAADK